MEKINLYDFDKTIYDGDSSVNFFLYSVKRKPKILRRLPAMIIAATKYKLKKIDKTTMKVTIFGFLNDLDDVDKDVIDFWKKNKNKIKKFYNEKNHSKDIIISASPEFLLEPITKELKVKMLIGSPVDKKTGKFTGLNCHDVEKVRRLNEVMSDYEVEEAYSDSTSDDPILKLAKKAYYVKKDKLIEAKFK